MFAHRAVRVVIARLTHGHVGWLLGRAEKGDVQAMGIYEPDADVVERYAKQFGFDRRLAHTDFESMLDAIKPEAVVAFGSIAEHLSVVEAAAPRGIHVMVEKPLAFTIEHAEKMEALAKRHSIHVLTNYETTWYPSGYTAFQLVHGDEAVGPIRKVVVRDGHFGPKEIASCARVSFLAHRSCPERRRSAHRLRMLRRKSDDLADARSRASDRDSGDAATEARFRLPKGGRRGDRHPHLPGRTGDHSGILELARSSQGLGDLRHARQRLHSRQQERAYALAR